MEPDERWPALVSMPVQNSKTGLKGIEKTLVIVIVIVTRPTKVTVVLIWSRSGFYCEAFPDRQRLEHGIAMLVGDLAGKISFRWDGGLDYYCLDLFRS